MSRRKLAALAASFVAATVLGGTDVRAADNGRAATVIVKCTYLTGDSLLSRVSGLETAGAIEARLSADLQTATTCAEAFDVLARAGFGLVSSTVPHVHADAGGDGTVDARDYLLWQRH